MHQTRRGPEAGVLLEPLGADRHHRHLAEPGVGEPLAQHARVVRRPAHAAGLGDHHRGVVRVGRTGDVVVHQLPDHHDRGVARVVVDVLQAGLDVGGTGVLQQFDPVAGPVQRGHHQPEVHRRHLRGVDGVVAPGLLGEHRARPGVGGDLGTAQPGGAFGGGRLQRAQPDPGRAEVRHLVDLEQCVDVPGRLQDLLHLVGGDRVHPAAEGVQLHQRQCRLPAHHGGRLVQAGVVGPLVPHPQRTRQRGSVDDAVLGEHRHAQAGDQLGDAVVDLGVDVVRPSGQHDAAQAALGDPRQCPPALGEDVGLGLGVLGETGGDGLGRLVQRDVVVGEHLDQPTRQVGRVGEVQERVEVADAGLPEPRHVVGQHLGVEGDDRAVEVVVGAREQLLLVGDARQEDGVHAGVEQVLQVAVGELGRVADVLGGDRLHPVGEDVVAGAARQDHPEAEPGQDREPQRVVLVHVQHPRDADVAARRLGLGEPAVAEDPPVLEVVQVGDRALPRRLLGARPALAAVARDVPGAVGEGRDGELAVVLAEPAGVEARLHAEGVQPGRIQQCAGRARLVVSAGGQRRAVGAHQPRDVGTDDLGAGEQFEGSQHRVVEEGAALHDDLLAELGGVLELDHLVERVADDRVRQPGGDVADVGALLLRLLHRRVHEHRAAAAEVDRGGRLGGGAGEARHVRAHRLGEGLQERAATGRAGLVHGDGVDHAVPHPQVLHVLPADVDHRGDPRRQRLGRPVVGHGLDLALVGMQGGAQQVLAVAGHAAARHPGLRRQVVVQGAHDRHRGAHRVALVGRVVGVQQPAGGVEQHRLDGGRARVDAEEAVAAGRGQLGARHLMRAVPRVERRPFRGVGEQRAQCGMDGRELGGAGQGRHEPVQRRGLAARQQRGPERDVELGVLGGGDAGELAVQRPDVRRPQLGQEVQRTAEEDQVAPDRVPAGEPRDGLGGDRLEHRGGQVGVRGALVQQWLQVALGEHPAAGGDRVEVGVAGRERVQPGGVGVQQRRHLVDERARPPGAGAVHALLRHRVQVSDLGVLAAEFDHHVGLGQVSLDRGRRRDHLLHEADPQQVGDQQAPGAGDGDPEAAAGVPGRDLREQGADLATDVSVVASVVRVHQPAVVEHDRLHRGRPDVQPQP